MDSLTRNCTLAIFIETWRTSSTSALFMFFSDILSLIDDKDVVINCVFNALNEYAN